jgi:hypothetical protein
MSETLEGRRIVGFLLIWVLHWGLGWGGQGLARLVSKTWGPEERQDAGRGSFEEQVSARWYWRLLLGYPPTHGNVAIRPAVIQFSAILVALVGSLLVSLVGPQEFGKLVVALLIAYWILVILALGFLDRR